MHKEAIILLRFSSVEEQHKKFRDFSMKKIATLTNTIHCLKARISADVKFEGQPLTQFALATQGVRYVIIVKSLSVLWTWPTVHNSVEISAGIHIFLVYWNHKQIIDRVKGSTSFIKSQYRITVKETKSE